MNNRRHTSRVPMETFLAAINFPPDLSDFIKYEFDNNIYYYGAHFEYGYDRYNGGRDINLYRSQLFEFYWRNQSIVEAEIAKAGVSNSDCKNIVFSNTYFERNNHFETLGLRLMSPPWVKAEIGNLLSVSLFTQCRIILELFKSGFNIFYDNNFTLVLYSIIKNLENFFTVYNAQGLMIPYTNGFFEAASTVIFKNINKPSFLCIHGIPGRLDWWKFGELSVDYLVVWGDAFKRRIIETGRLAESVLVSGHPKYSGLPIKNISSCLDRVLVLTWSESGAPILNTPYQHDRSRCLDYLWRVQICLRKVGVTQARLRPHPSESKLWYKNHVDSRFYQIDNNDKCADSLNISTLVIGPVSTVMLEAAVTGVNYISFIPDDIFYNPSNQSAFSPDLPFDGTDRRFPVARCEKSLIDLIKTKTTIDPAALCEYISPKYQPNVISDIINANSLTVNKLCGNVERLTEFTALPKSLNTDT